MNSIEEQIRAEDSKIGGYLWVGRLVILTLVLGVGGWAAFSKISGAVIASGAISVEARSKQVQHLEGGIVREILVQDGDLVRANQLLLRLDSGQLKQQAIGLDSEIESKRLEIELVTSELDGLSALAAKGLVPKARVLRLKRQAARLKGELGKVIANKARTVAMLSRLEVRAPIGGYVHNLAFHTIGGVAAPGQELMQIVPSEGRMIAQLRVEPGNIDEVQKGQSVVMKLSGFNQTIAPEIMGQVVHVSADLTRDKQSNAPFYLVHGAIPSAQTKSLGLKLLPGMPVEAFIQKERRSVLSYLVRPFTDQLSRAFREE